MTESSVISRTGSGAGEAGRVGDRYRLTEVIGTGGMGRVWLAEDELLGRRVAVKEITSPPAGLPDARTVREARAAARLDHPNVVKIFDVVWWSGRSWIVMEYAGPRSLHAVVRDEGPLPHREAARIGLQILAALRAAHATGVLHRDVKPHNVLIGTGGRVVLTDFGLATTDDPDDAAEPVMGSPYFMAPERLGTTPSGPAGDLWSLGATLYAATEGRPPFARDETTGSLLALATEPPDRPLRPGPLTPVILDLLAKDPAQRPSGAALEPRLRRVAEAVIGVARPSTRVAAPLGTGGWRGRAAVPTSRNRFDR
jgi:serine/threonine protein kinase